MKFGPRAYSTAKNILEQGFKRIGSDKSFKKTPAHLSQLVAAGKELGIPKSLITQVYEGAKPGMSNPERMTPELQDKIKQHDIEMFSTPSPQDFGRPFEFDDLPSAAHLQLEEHRDLRSLVRAAAYELPLLAQYRTAYRKPTDSQNLRFKYNVFVNEDHPATAKVVLEFTPESTGLTDKALHKLKLLAGRRYDFDTNIIKISSAKFPDQSQNKRYLGQVYTKLLQSAKDPSDDFSDVPLDPRPFLKRKSHQKPLYPNYKFPEEWKRPDLAPKPKEDILSVLCK